MSGRRIGWRDEKIGVEIPGVRPGGGEVVGEVDYAGEKFAAPQTSRDEVRLECYVTLNGETCCMHCASAFTGSVPTALVAPRACFHCKKPITDLWPVPPTNESVRGSKGPVSVLPMLEESVCPVCGTAGRCACDEEDRAFLRRARFEAEVATVPRCPRCSAPLSVAFLPRPGAGEPPYRLASFVAIYGCALCHGRGLAVVLDAFGEAEDGEETGRAPRSENVAKARRGRRTGDGAPPSSPVD